jgi:hypothetical protein
MLSISVFWSVKDTAAGSPLTFAVVEELNPPPRAVA